MDKFFSAFVAAVGAVLIANCCVLAVYLIATQADNPFTASFMVAAMLYTVVYVTRRYLRKGEAVTDEWQPIESAPKLKGKDGRPHRLLVTYAPCTGAMPLDVVWWGRYSGGRRWTRVDGTPLRYEPTHWRPMLDAP